MSFLKPKKLTLSIVAVVALFAATLSLAGPSTAVFADPHGCIPDQYIWDEASGQCVPVDSPGGGGVAGSCPERVFTFPAWYKGVIDRSTCDIKIVNISDFIKIPLNFLEILIQLVAYAAVVFIIWGGIRYTKSEGDPSQLTTAKSTISNAITGLIIALASVAIVEFIQGRFSQ